jgi:hypothetical protein
MVYPSRLATAVVLIHSVGQSYRFSGVVCLSGVASGMILLERLGGKEVDRWCGGGGR